MIPIIFSLIIIFCVFFVRIEVYWEDEKSSDVIEEEKTLKNIIYYRLKNKDIILIDLKYGYIYYYDNEKNKVDKVLDQNHDINIKKEK